MNILFIHQNFPGQFGKLAEKLAENSENRVVTLGEKKKNKRFRKPGVIDYWYEKPSISSSDTHAYLRLMDTNVRRGQAVYRALRALRKRGENPGIVVVHPGWGESLFIKDIFPQAKVILYCEFYYSSCGGDFGFDQEKEPNEDAYLRIRIKNATQLLALENFDAGYSPTQWQKKRFPDFVQDKIRCIHDGVDTVKVFPNPEASLKIGENGPGITPDDEVLTYCARNLEPHRGFHIFMRALPEILERRPECRVNIVGGDEVSYGRYLPMGQTYREKMIAETGLDSDRVHFLGRVPYAKYLSMLQCSTVHAYLTYPFVLSWSAVEAMSAGCLIVGSDTEPVREVIQDGKNGFLVDFHDSDAFADKIVWALENREEMSGIRAAARQTVVDKYNFETRSLPSLLELIEEFSSP